MLMADKKTILFVRPHMAKGGADQVTLMLLRHIDRADYEVSLALMRSEGPLMEDIPDDVTVIDCKARSLWFMIAPLYKLLKENDFDIVYCTCGGASMPLCIAHSFLPRKKKAGNLIVSERNILLPLYKGRMKRYFMLYLKRLFYKEADFVTAVSRGVAVEVNKYLKVPEGQIRVVDNPVIDQKLFEKAAEGVEHPWFDQGHFVFLAVGRLVEQKDYPTLLAAFRLAKKENQKLKLIVLGDGHLKTKLETMIRNMDLQDDVDFLGYRKNPFSFMRKADAFVLASKHEGMPGVLVQAMAINGHCIATDCPTGPNEIIENGQGGLLVPVGKPESLADAILSITKDHVLYERIKAHAGDQLGKFEISKALESYLSFIS